MTTKRRTHRDSEAIALRGPLSGLIADRMKSQGIDSVKEFADKYGIGRTTLYDLLRGRSDGTVSNPSLETIARLADALERPSHEILYLVNPHARGAELQIGVAQVPVFLAGQVGAGPDQMFPLDQQVFVESEFAEGRDLIAFKVVGDSMEGGRRPIFDGDVVIVDQRVGPEVNMPVVARLVGNGYVVKRYRPGGILDSANPDITDPKVAHITPDRVDRMVGRVVRVLSTVV